jgi:prephenate dehydratase
LIAITPHTNRLGLLAELLDEFRFYQLDIAKIHSRPAIDAVEGPDEPQMFYLEVKCAPDAEALHRCAEAIRYRFGGGALSGDPVRVMGGFRI